MGSGLGGAARFVGSRYGCRVTGLDLTADDVETARILGEWAGLAGRLRFHPGAGTKIADMTSNIEPGVIAPGGGRRPARRLAAPAAARPGPAARPVLLFRRHL